MIKETQEQLMNSRSKMDVSFILLKDQQNVYDEFSKYLNRIKSPPAAVPKTVPTSKTNAQSNIAYNEKSKII
jgi:hypothetical protein